MAPARASMPPDKPASAKSLRPPVEKRIKQFTSSENEAFLTRPRPSVMAATIKTRSSRMPKKSPVRLRRTALTSLWPDGHSNIRRRGSIHNSTGPPSSAVAAPTGRRSPVTFCNRLTHPSVNQSKIAPMAGAVISFVLRRRAPDSCASVGATRPTKPSMPTSAVMPPPARQRW